MITFLDENDVEYGALTTLKTTNAVNGERSISGEIISGDYVLSHIERGWRLRFEDEYYVITYAKPIDGGRQTSVSFDAVHQFFWDFDKSSVHSQLKDGSHTFDAYLEFIFKDSGYRYTVDSLLKISAFSKQSFGYKKRLTLFNDIIKSTGVEFAVSGKVVRILAKAGTDLSTVVRKNFNLNELGIEKNIGDFVTYQKGFGAWNDSEDHSKGRLEVEYESPLASVYGRLEAEPFVDERYTISENMLSVLKENVDNSYTISVKIDMEDLTKAGYDYTQPRAGDYIMAINETLGFQEKIRIVSYVSEYDVKGALVKHEVTCNDIGSVKKQSAGYSVAKKQMQSTADNVNKALEVANRAMVSAEGKNTVYFGVEFPKDEPKGTLKKGDSLYLRVGEETKMYFWNGAEWEEPPVVNDVEKFKHDIAEEFETVNTTIQANEAERAKQAREFLAQAGASTDLANTAKRIAEEAKAGYAEAVSKAQQLKSDLEGQLATTKSTVARQAQQLADQARTQTELQTLVSETKKTADGAKTTLTELTKTVNATTGSLDGVTKRVASVETSLSGVREQYQSVQTTLDSQNQAVRSVTSKTADLERGLDGVRERFDNIKIGTANLVKNSKINKSSDAYGFDTRTVNLVAGKTYWFGARAKKTGGTTDKKVLVALYYPDWSDTKGLYFETTDYEIKFDKFIPKKTGEYQIRSYWYPKGGDRSGTADVDWYMVTESDLAPTDYQPAEEDLRHEFAEYKRTATENSAELGRRVQGLDGGLSETKTLAQQTADGIRQLATKTEVNAVTGRLSTAESSIRQQADQIAQRLTSTQVESAITAKGYQTKAQVDANVTGRGYITNDTLAGYVQSSVFDNYKRETAQSIERQLTETRGMIPTRVDYRNWILESDDKITQTSAEGAPGSKMKRFRFAEGFWKELNLRRELVLSVHVKGRMTPNTATNASKNNRIGIELPGITGWGYIGVWDRRVGTSIDERVEIKAKLPDGLDVSGLTHDIGMYIQCTGDVVVSRPKATIGNVSSDWSPANEDMVTGVDFNRVRETAQLYERTIGTTREGIADTISRMAMTSEIFQVEVGKSLAKSDNLVYDPTNYSRHKPRSNSNASDYYMTGTNTYKLLVIKQTGHTTAQWRGFQVPLRTATFTKGEKLSYRVNLWVDVLPDDEIRFEIRNSGTPLGGFSIAATKTGASQIFTGTFTVLSDSIVTDDYGLHVWLRKNGQVAIGQISIVRGETPPENFVDNTSAQEIANSSRLTLMENSFALKTLNSNGDVITAVNGGPEGLHLQGRLIHLNGRSIIDEGIIKSAMIETLHGGKIVAGTITGIHIQSKSVTGDKILFNEAFFDNMTANTVVSGTTTTKKLFSTIVQSVEISADKINGGKLTALNRAMEIDLNTGAINFLTDSPAIRRSVSGLPNQFVKFSTRREANDNTFKKLNNNPTGSYMASVTSIGTNRSNSESVTDGAFTGINIYASGSATGTEVVDRIGIHSDITIISHSFLEGQKGWIFENTNPQSNDYVMRPMSPAGSLHKSAVGLEGYPVNRMYIEEIYMRTKYGGYHRLTALLTQLGIKAGLGWQSDF
ncbi:putative nucleic acid-binding Zn-ribbon protein [Streptococcus rupicaprae]|uniref:Nucleic acid-binding Zn-ribbon protein n=1 Tax=Streptococcus rupicaprae TaxID=759619 RepID=A0ABV2FJG6_9STRE